MLKQVSFIRKVFLYEYTEGLSLLFLIINASFLVENKKKSFWSKEIDSRARIRNIAFPVHENDGRLPI